MGFRVLGSSSRRPRCGPGANMATGARAKGLSQVATEHWRALETALGEHWDSSDRKTASDRSLPILPRLSDQRQGGLLKCRLLSISVLNQVLHYEELSRALPITTLRPPSPSLATIDFVLVSLILLSTKAALVSLGFLNKLIDSLPNRFQIQRIE